AVAGEVTSPLVGEIEPAEPAREGGDLHGVESAPLPIRPAYRGAEQHPAAAEGQTAGLDVAESDESPDSPWPDLVLIDGGLRQLNAARETLAELGVQDVPLVAIAKGPDREAGRETFFRPGQEPF